MVDECGTRISDECAARSRRAPGSQLDGVGREKAAVSAHFLRQVIQKRENEAMKRPVGTLSILGLLGVMVLPAASAAVLYQDDFSSGKVKGVNGVYIQGKNPQVDADA